MENPTHVFIEDKDEIFVPALIISSSAGKITVQDTRDENKVITVAEQSTFPIASLEELDIPPSDLILLSIVHRPAILHTLRSRFFTDQIYTNVGAILVSMNPFKRIAGLYSHDVMQEFSSTVTDRPHVFAIAQNAYDGLKRGKNQSLIISGESGAGKTEATKQGLAYLAYVAGSTSGVQEKVLLSSPILEAWGNAKTNRNDNSSRFGKFIEVWFGRSSDIVGASTTTYLLEKSRVVFQDAGERNYHVFYQLLFGADEQLLASLNLTRFARDPESVTLINQSGCIQMESIDDHADYQAVDHALRSLGFSPEDILNLSRVVAGVLHFGNIVIQPPNITDRCTMSDATAENFEHTIDLWSVDVDLMQQSMFVKTVAVKSTKRSSFVLSPLSHGAALENRNALAKEIYNRCFDWIVEKLNLAMGAPSSTVGSIGVLDIFGFEIFIKNSLEQLCINLANEALQQHFNFNIFQAEMEFYRSEDIAIPELNYSDNQDVLDLITKRGGIIAMLDEEGIVPNGSSEGFLNKITKAFSTHKRFVAKPRTREFGVRHYAGEVTYDPTLFLSKNKDTISQDIIDVMKESNNGFIAALFMDKEQPLSSSTAAGAGSSSAAGGKDSKSSANTNANKQTVGKRFSVQLEALMATLNKTQPHYIRCIKPNQVKRSGIFESKTANEQLTYSGIFEAVIIMQNGYPFRLTLSEFLKRYHMLVLDSTIRRNEIFNTGAVADSTSSRSVPTTPTAKGRSSTNISSTAGAAVKDKGSGLRQRCAALVKHAASIHAEEVLKECHVGKTMVLYRSAPHKCLEQLRHTVMSKGTVTSQRFFRGSIVRLIIKRVKAILQECRQAIAMTNVPKIKQSSEELRTQVDKLQKVTKSMNIKDFPIIQIAQDYAVALIKEKQNEETIQRLLSNSAVSHVIANIDELSAANEAIKSVSFNADLEGKNLRRVWSDNPRLLEADTRIRRLRLSVDMRKLLKDAVSDRDDLRVEDVMMQIQQLREQRELVSGYCSEDEKKGLKIVNDAKVAFNELLNRSIVSLVNGELTLKRMPESSQLDVQVSATSISELFNNLIVHPSFSNANNSNTRAKLLMALVKFIKELRVEAEQRNWRGIEGLLQQFEVCAGHTGMSRALLADSEPGKGIVLYAPPEIEASVLAEIAKARICVVQFLVLPQIQVKLQQSPALANQFSLDVPSAYLQILKDVVDELRPYSAVLATDAYLKNLIEVVEIRELLWVALFEGNASNIRNAMASLKLRGLSLDPDYEYAGRLLQMHNLRETIARALENDGPTGQPGDMNFDSISVDSLGSALSEAAGISVDHALWNAMITYAGNVHRLRVLLGSGNFTDALTLAQGLDVARYISGTYVEDMKRKIDTTSSGYLLLNMTVLCAQEISNCRRELFHLKAVETLTGAIRSGAIAGEVGGIILTGTDPASMNSALKAIERTLIRTDAMNRLLHDIDVVTQLRKLASANDWVGIEPVVNEFYASSNRFEHCHDCIRKELIIVHGEVLDRELRKLLSECIGRCKFSTGGTDRNDAEDVCVYSTTQIGPLANCIGRIESSEHKSFETSYLLATARILLQLARSVNAGFWEPKTLFCSSMSTAELTSCFGVDDTSKQFKEMVESIDEGANFEALEHINSAAFLDLSDGSDSLEGLSVAELLVRSSYVGIHALATEELNRLKKVSFDRRCRACLLLGVLKGRIGGSIHSGFDISHSELSPLIRALKYIKIYQRYWSSVMENWEVLATELLNVRLAVLSAEAATSTARIELSSYLNLEHLNNLIDNAHPGFPLGEIRFVVDNVNDILMIKSIFDALMTGRPQYVMGVFSTQYVEYEHLASLLQRSKKLRQRSDKLDRLMFYSDLCVLARKAFVSHHWDDAHRSHNNSSNKTADRNPGVKQCVEEYRLANKFFSMNRMEGIPPKCLIDEFESMEREFDKRNILQDFSAVLQSGAITGAPFALHFREISVTSLEAQVQRVRKWEEATGIVDIDLETLCKACSEILQIRMQAKEIQGSYKRTTVLATPSNDVKDILRTSYVTDCIDLALANTAALTVTPFPMVREWEAVEKLVTRVEVLTSLRSSKQEIELVTAESYARTFIARVVSIFMSLGPDNAFSFAKANQAVIDLTYAFQSYLTRVRDMKLSQKGKKSQYTSPILEMIHDSAVLGIYLLRADKLNCFDVPNRNWRQVELDTNITPRISQLTETLADGRYSVQALLRTCLGLTLHPRLVAYAKYLACIVEDKVTEMELLAQLKKTAGRRRSMVGDMDKKSITTDSFLGVIARVDAVGIHSEELRVLHRSSVLVCDLRIFTKNMDFEGGFRALLNFVDQGSCRNFGELLTSLNRGKFNVHSNARMEFVQLTLELCDGYWRQLAEQSLVTGAVVGQRGCLHVQDITWVAIDEVISYSKAHLELSPESYALLDVCFALRNLRSMLLGLDPETEKRRSLQLQQREVCEPVLEGSLGRVNIVSEDYIENLIDGACLTVNALAAANNLPPTAINFVMAFEQTNKLQCSVDTSNSLSEHIKTSVLEEVDLIKAQLTFLNARSQLLLACDVQSIWFTEFGLETRNQLLPQVQAAVDAALTQNWDSGVAHEAWCRGLLDTVLSIQLLHEQIRFTGLSAVQPCTPHFESILPYVEGVLDQHRFLQQLDSAPGGGVGSSRIPKNLSNLVSHLQAALTERANIAKLIAMLNSDKMYCEANYAGKYLMYVTHENTIVGLSHHNTEYGPYVLKLKMMMDKVRVSTFAGRQIQKLAKMFGTMRMHVKQSHFGDALALSEAIGVVDPTNTLVSQLRVQDCLLVQRYCTFLKCRRSLEQSLCGCLLPPCVGWSEFGAAPVLGLAINDAPLAEAVESVFVMMPSYATDYPEIMSLMELGMLFLKLVAAIRTKSWKTLSEVARAAAVANQAEGSSAVAASVAAAPAPKSKGRRHSMLTTGLDNLKSTAAVSSAAAISIETNSSLSILDSLPAAYRPQYASLKNSILFHCGDTVEHIVSNIRNFIQQPKVVLDDAVRNLVTQIASLAETEIKFAELEAASVSVFRDCKINGSPGDLNIPSAIVRNLRSALERLDAEYQLCNACYSLKRARQTAKVMILVHESLALGDDGMETLGKCLCLLSFMGSRKRLVQEAKCEDYIYKELFSDEALLSIDEFTFKASIVESVRKLGAVSLGYSMQLENASNYSSDSKIGDNEGDAESQLLDALAADYLDCGVDDVVRLRDEFFDDLSLLEQHFTLECHYADYKATLQDNFAVGEPGDLDVSTVEFDPVATMLHSLSHFGLTNPTSCPAGSLLYMCLEAIYLIRKSQNLGDFNLLRTALQGVEAAEAAEKEYNTKKQEDWASSSATMGALSADYRLRKRALELGLSSSFVTEGNDADFSIQTRPFVALAANEITVAQQDFAQRELIIGLRKGINEAVVTLQILNEIDVFNTKASAAASKGLELPISLLYYSVNTLSKDTTPTSRKAQEMTRTAEALLQIRQAINGKKWLQLRRLIESLDLVSVSPTSREEVNVALRIAVVANVIEKSGRAYKVGSIFGHPGKIENFQDIDYTVVEEAVKAFEDIADSWRTADIVMHYNSCVALAAVRKYFRQHAWLIARDVASISLDPIRLSAKPLFVAAEVEIRLALDHSTYMICFLALSTACSTGRLRGDVGNIDTSEVSVLVLSKALAVSKTLNSSMAEIAVLETSAEILRDMRQAQLVGNWINSSSHADAMESFSVERAVLATSYSVQPADVFGHSLDGLGSHHHAHSHGRFMSVVQSSTSGEEVGAGQGYSIIAPMNQNDAESAFELQQNQQQLSHKFVVQSTLLDPDLCNLYTAVKSRSRHNNSNSSSSEASTPLSLPSSSSASALVPSSNTNALNALTSIRSVKEIIQHARELQNSMELSPLILDELELAANEVQYRELSFNLLKAIRTSGIGGEPGALDMSKVRTHDLAEAISAAEGNSEISRKSGCRWLLRDAKILLSLRQKTMQHNWKLLSILFRDVERQNSPDYIDPVDKSPGLPIILPVWREVQLVMADLAFQMCLAQFAQEMQNLHEYAAVGTKNSRRVVAMIRCLVTTIRASSMYPCQLFAHLIEAQSAALELRVFHNFEPDKNPVEIIHRVGEAKRRDASAGKVSYMTLLMSDISNMSNVVDKQMHVDALQNELIQGQLYLMRPLGRIDASVLDVTRLSKALEVAMPLVSVMGSPSEIKLLRVCEAAVAIRTAVKSENWSSVREALDNPEFADALKSSFIHDEVDRLQCEIENYDACVLLERTMYMGRFMNVVNLARLECKPRGSVIERAMSAGEKRRVSQLPNSFFGGLESLERAMLAGNIVTRRSEILNSYLRAASLIYRIRDKMAHGQWEDLKTLLQDESKYSTLPQFAMEEIRAVKAGMAYRNTMFSVCNALINGCVTGVPGNVIISTVDAYALQQALNEAANLDMSDTATAVMYDVGTCICKLRNAVKEGRWFPAGGASSLDSEVVSPAPAPATNTPTAPKTMAAFMFESINSSSDDEPEQVDEILQSSRPFMSSSTSNLFGGVNTTAAVSGNNSIAETSSPSPYKPFSSTTSAFGRLNNSGIKGGERRSSTAVVAVTTCVHDVVKEFLAKKDVNYRLLREALSIDDNEDEDNKDQDWMLQQWEALLQVEKEVELVSGELKERKVSSSLVHALETIPSIVQNFSGMNSFTGRQVGSGIGNTSRQQQPNNGSSVLTGPESSSDPTANENSDPLNIHLLEEALEECSVPSLSSSSSSASSSVAAAIARGGANDEVSRETERLIRTAQLILRFRQSLQSFDLDNFKELLEEARLQQAQGLISSHYGLQELAVYRSSAVAIQIAKSKLLQNMRSGCVSGRLDAVQTERIDSSVLFYWLNACTALAQTAKGIVGDLNAHIEEATVLIKLRDAVKANEWTRVYDLLGWVPSSSTSSISSATSSSSLTSLGVNLVAPSTTGGYCGPLTSIITVSMAEVEHIWMICRYREASAELTSLLTDDVCVMDSALVTRIPPLESCLGEISAVLKYDSPLLPALGGSLSSDRELRDQFRVGTNVLQLWRAIKQNHWRIENISQSRIHDLDRPKDPLLARLFDSISQHEVARKLDTIHSQLTALGFDKTAHVQPHRNIRGSIHQSSLVLSGQGLNPAHALDSLNPLLGLANRTFSDHQQPNVSVQESCESVASAATKPKKMRRVSVITDPTALTGMHPSSSSSTGTGPTSSAGGKDVKASRRRSVSEVAPRLKVALNSNNSNEYLDPSLSASAILCREDWSSYPSNIRKLFNSARDKLIDLILRARLMYGCQDGAVQLDAEGDLVVPPMCTDVMDIVITDISRLRSFCVRYGVQLKLWPITEQWFNTARTLMKCRRALAFHNIEAVAMEMMQQGYLGRFRKADFDQRPCREELDRIERFMFEHLAERAVRKALDQLLAIPTEQVLDAQAYHSKYMDALKAVCVLPQSMRPPTQCYIDLMTVARELRHAVAAAVMGDLGRLVLTEAAVSQLTLRSTFPLADIHSSFALLFGLFKAAIVGSKRFRTAAGAGAGKKSKAKSTGNTRNTNQDMAALRRNLEQASIHKLVSEQDDDSSTASAGGGNPYASDLRRKLSSASSNNSDSPVAPKRSLASILFGTTQPAAAAQRVDTTTTGADNSFYLSTATATATASTSVFSELADYDGNDFYQELNRDVRFDEEDDTTGRNEQENSLAGATAEEALQDPFGAPEDVAADTADFVSRRLRRSMECPGLVYVQACEISELSYPQFDGLLSVAQGEAGRAALAPLWDKILHEVITYRPLKSQQSSAQHQGGGVDSSQQLLPRSYNRVKSLLAEETSQPVEQLQHLFSNPTVEPSVIDALQSAISHLSPIFRIQEPLVLFSSALLHQVLLLSHATRIRTQATARFNVVPVPMCVQEFVSRLRASGGGMGGGSKSNSSSNQSAILGHNLKSVDYFSFSVFLQRAVRYGVDVNKQKVQQLRLEHRQQQQLRRQQQSRDDFDMNIETGDDEEDDDDMEAMVVPSDLPNTIAVNFRATVESLYALAKRCEDSSHANSSNNTRSTASTESQDGEDSNEDNTKQEDGHDRQIFGATARVLTLCQQVLKILDKATA